jgi:hypothetical protein
LKVAVRTRRQEQARRLAKRRNHAQRKFHDVAWHIRWPRGNRRTVRHARPRRIQLAAFERRGVGPRAWNSTKSAHGKSDGCVVASAHAELQQRGRFKIGHFPLEGISSLW